MELKPASTPALQPFRWWQAFSRSLLHLRLRGPDGVPQTWSVDVRHGGDADGEVYAHLYRDGLHMARLKPPVAFPLPGGTIRIAVSTYGLQAGRLRYPRRRRAAAGAGCFLRRRTARAPGPDPAGAEPAYRGDLRTGAPRSLALGVPQLLQSVTEIPRRWRRVSARSSARFSSRRGRTRRFCWRVWPPARSGRCGCAITGCSTAACSAAATNGP